MYDIMVSLTTHIMTAVDFFLFSKSPHPYFIIRPAAIKYDVIHTNRITHIDKIMTMHTGTHNPLRGSTHRKMVQLARVRGAKKNNNNKYRLPFV